MFIYYCAGISLEEMDRYTNCPENIDKTTWTLMCKLRREKIGLEEAVKALGRLLNYTVNPEDSCTCTEGGGQDIRYW
jgi:hypothetical protein